MTAGLPAERGITAAHAASSGVDLLGWSALPLLADPAAEGNWLFVLEPFRGWQSSGPLADARFDDIPLPSTGLWPFADSSLGGVVIDGDAVAQGADDSAVLRCLGEAARCVATERNILIVCGERRMPRSLRELRDYSRSSGQVWQRAVSELSGLESSRPVALASFDGSRLTGLRTSGGRESSSAERLLLRVSSHGGPVDSVLAAMVGEASQFLNVELRVDRVAVRKIGKTAVFLAEPGGRRYILRAARSPIARRRALRNFEALESLRASSLPERVTALVPGALARGACGSYEYFLEACLEGHGGPSRQAQRDSGWVVEAVNFISLLHRQTARRMVVDDRFLHRFIGAPAATIVRACATPAAERTLDRLIRRCEDALRGRTIPVVRTHGDFTESNCLFHPDGHLVGVVDWELSEAEGLPLLDLLQLMPVEGEHGRADRWQRFDAWMRMWWHPETATADSSMADYIRTVGIDAATISPLALVHWVTHVADRIEARRDDRRWMQMRVWGPLDALGRALSE